MKDLFPDNDGSNPEFENVPLPELPLEVLLAIAPPEILNKVVDDGIERVKEIAVKIGKIASIAGHSTFRAGTGVNTGENNCIESVIGYMSFAIDNNALIEIGRNPQEVIDKLNFHLQALNEYFDELKNA